MKKWVRTNPTDFTNDKLRKVFEDFLDYLRSLDDEKGAQYARFLTQALEGAIQEQVRQHTAALNIRYIYRLAS